MRLFKRKQSKVNKRKSSSISTTSRYSRSSSSSDDMLLHTSTINSSYESDWGNAPCPST